MASSSDIVINDVPKVVIDEVTIGEQEESVVDVEGIKAKGWSINGMTSNTDGNIVITGAAIQNFSHITVINKKGEIKRQDQIKRENYFGFLPYRYCCYLSDYKVATVCVPDKIGIYDVRDGSYKEKDVSDAISSWPPNKLVCCVATDAATNHIIVGTNSRFAYVLDDQMNYIHTITLPDRINMVTDFTVHGDNLLICDCDSKRAYSVNMDGSYGKLIYEFTKPDLRGFDWRPYGVCTDKNDFIYMLWGDGKVGGRRILVQYSQGGRQLLTRKEVNSYAACVTAVEEDGSEKLLVATLQFGKLHAYSLIVT